MYSLISDAFILKISQQLFIYSDLNELLPPAECSLSEEMSHMLHLGSQVTSRREREFIDLVLQACLFKRLQFVGLLL